MNFHVSKIFGRGILVETKNDLGNKVFMYKTFAKDY